MENKIGFGAAEILLPDFTKVEGTRWAVVACDQYTSEPQYWEEAERIVADAPSTLRMILPEVYLSESEARIPVINAAMEKIHREVLEEHPDAMICLARTQSDGKIRYGIIGAVDLECYDYNKGSTSLVRATEGTVLERIPPRVAIRRNASLEMPHVMLLIDDPARTVIEPVVKACAARETLYDFDLMQNGGHVTAYLMTKDEQSGVEKGLAALITPEAIRARYGDASLAPLLFAVGDGNHSLATAKAAYEEVKAKIGADAAKNHPARYALAEVVNLHDDALEFEPIYRVIFNCDPQNVMEELKAYTASLQGNAAEQRIECITAQETEFLTVAAPEQQLAIGTLQTFLFDYAARHPEVEVDYIHGVESLTALAKAPNSIGFLFEGMRKDELFRSVLYDGALPRKTFSMGHADDKRFYLECRAIQ